MKEIENNLLIFEENERKLLHFCIVFIYKIIAKNILYIFL